MRWKMQSRQPNSLATPIRNRLHLPFGQRKVSARYICKTVAGHSRYLWSAEIYRGANHSGRYLTHGSMQLLAEKYGGELTFRQEGDVVNTYMLLPLAPAET